MNDLGDKQQIPCLKASPPLSRCVARISPLAFVAIMGSALVSVPTISRGEFPEVINTEHKSIEALMTADEAAAAMKLPAGFRVTPFAAEPDVQNPIGMSWDARGRLWIAENYTYAEPSQRFDLRHRDRVLWFADHDGDGVSDERHVFLDQVQRLTSVEVGHGGVWLMCPPQVLFVPDGDHDGTPDGPPKVVLDGFTVAQDNYHNFANGLRFGPDGWLYGRCGGSCPGRIGRPGTPDEQRHALEGGLWRYHPIQQTIEVLSHGTTNPWGHDWTASGQAFFINTVNGHLWHAFPGAHFKRPFLLDPNPYVYELIDQHADHWHFDTQGTWQQSRDGAANSFGGGHAHTGMMIYLGDNWPTAYRGNLFTLNLHGRRANCEHLVREGSGFVGQHGDDFFLAADPWFRGIDLSYGPDGGVFVLDWSDTGECHEHDGVHRTSGRIYKIVYGDVTSWQGNLYDATIEQLIDLHSHANEWHVRQARRVLAERAANDKSVAEGLKRRLTAVVAQTNDASQRIRLAQTLNAITDDHSRVASQLLAAGNEDLRCLALRMITDDWPLDGVYGTNPSVRINREQVVYEARRWLPSFIQMAKSDESGLVLLTLASTLQRLPLDFRADLAAALVSRSEYAQDHNLPLLVWYGLISLADEDPGALVKVAIASQWPTTTQSIARRLMSDLKQHPMPVNLLLEAMYAAPNPARDAAAVHGMTLALRGWRSAPAPDAWHRVQTQWDDLTDKQVRRDLRELRTVFGDGRALNELKTIALDENAATSQRQDALRTLIASTVPERREICERLLPIAHLNVIAAEGLAYYNDPAIAKTLTAQYRRFREPDRPALISILVSRPVFARALLNAISQDQIPRSALSAYHVRQLHSLNDADLSQQVEEVWGTLNDSDESLREEIARLRVELANATVTGDELRIGRKLFATQCGKCHRMYGVGESVGPDLTGSGRHDLNYLLDNIVTPSAVVDAKYRMQVVETEDGRIFNGVPVAETAETLTLQTLTDRQILVKDEIAHVQTTPLSPMPTGLLQTLTADDIRCLIGYLRHPTQVDLPAE